MVAATLSSVADESPRLNEEGPDGIEQADGNFQRAIRDRIRHECRSKLQTCAMDPLSAMTMRDVADYMNPMEEQNLRGPDLRSEEDKTRAVTDLGQRFAENFIRQSRNTAATALALIKEAEDKKWIHTVSAQKWRMRLKNENKSWLEKKAFIEKTLPTFHHNWQSLAADYKKARDLEKALGITKEEGANYPELVDLHAEDFKNCSLRYPERRNRVNKAIAFLKAMEKDRQKGGAMKGNKGMQKLYTQAKDILEDAADRKVISPWKVGLWLKRIFQTEATEKRIQEFLTKELGSLAHNWTEVKQRFDAIEEKRKEKGTPRSFHFVHLDLFLSWNYRKREAYVREAEHRFTDIEKERYKFLLIRNALDTKDWEGAKALIEAERDEVEEMTDQDIEKLRSMEDFLHKHEPAVSAAKEGEKKSPTDLELVSRMRGLLSQVPASMRQTYIESLRLGYGAFWTNCTVDYNLVWCEEHGWWNPRKQMEKEEEAKECTPDRIDDGHGRGFEANDLRGANNRSAAIRKQDRLAAPQWLFMGPESAKTAADTFNRMQYSRNFWYWTSGIHEGVSFSQHRSVVKGLHPQLKSLAKQIDSRGIIYTQAGDLQYKATPRSSSKKAAPAEGNVYASKA
ncbi:MAG: hypothetical protein WCS85_00080 [Candidatus Peribacteraceae bacterium]